MYRELLEVGRGAKIMPWKRQAPRAKRSGRYETCRGQPGRRGIVGVGGVVGGVGGGGVVESHKLKLKAGSACQFFVVAPLYCIAVDNDR